MSRVIILEGINDIIVSSLPHHRDVSADAIIAGLEQLAARAHANGLLVYGGTLTPIGGTRHDTAASVAKREEVNRFIRDGTTFDAVIDFDKAVRDPGEPLRLSPAFDSGDHLHPNDQGYAARAASVPIELFDPR